MMYDAIVINNIELVIYINFYSLLLQPYLITHFTLVLRTLFITL